MTVNPGFGGQTLIPRCLEKVRALARLRKEGHHPYLIAVDGGVNRLTAPSLREAGADVLIAGSAFFQAPDKKELVSALAGP
jgi:ribulose-phosphate 3-epimerase